MAHILSALDYGGAEKVTIDQIRRRTGDAQHVLVICTSGREGSQASAVRALGCEVFVVRLKENPLASAVGMMNELKRLSIDCVVSHISLPSAAVLLVAALAGVKVRIARVHSVGDGKPNSPIRNIQRSALRLMMRFTATRVVGVSPLATSFARFRLLGESRRYEYVANSVGASDFDGFNSDGRVYYIGRSHVDKNRQLVGAVSGRWVELGNEPFVIFGEWGQDLEASERAIDFRGVVDEAANELSGGGALILTSLREGLATVVLEALCRGVPVCASDIPSNRWLASRVRGLILVGLDAPLEEWLGALRSVLAFGVEERKMIAAEFSESEFAERAVDDYWRTVFTAGRNV